MTFFVLCLIYFSSYQSLELANVSHRIAQLDKFFLFKGRRLRSMRDDVLNLKYGLQVSKEMHRFSIAFIALLAKPFHDQFPFLPLEGFLHQSRCVFEDMRATPHKGCGGRSKIIGRGGMDVHLSHMDKLKSHRVRER